jgi:WD40 repeat protein
LPTARPSDRARGAEPSRNEPLVPRVDLTELAVTLDGRFAVCARQDDNNVYVWTREGVEADGAVLDGKRLEGHSEPILTVAVTPDGKFAVSGSADKTVRVWDLEAGHEVAKFEGHEAAVRRVTVSTDGRTIFSLGEDGLRVWNLNSER